MRFGAWWFWWMGLMLLCLLPALGYGWLYRRWGFPLPRFLAQRRAQKAFAAGGATPFDPPWGWMGDFIWVVLIIGALYAVGAAWLGLG
jgi:hypothetical protein